MLSTITLFWFGFNLFAQTNVFEKADALIAKQQFDSARLVLNRLIPRFLSQQKPTDAYIAFDKIGTTYYNQSLYDQALKNYLMAAKLVRNSSNCSLILGQELNQARIKYAIGEKRAAIEYINQIKPEVMQCADDTLKYKLHYYLGVIHYELGTSDSASPALAYCLRCCQTWLSVAEKSKLYAVVGENRWIRQNDPKGGYADFLLSKKYADESGDLYAIAFANIKLGSFLLDEGLYTKSEIYLNTALKQVEQLNSLSDKIYVRRLIAKLQSEMGKAKETYKTLDFLWLLYDSMNKIEMRNTVADLRTKYETQKTEDENLLLKLNVANKDLQLASKSKRNQQLLSLLIFIVSIALFTYFSSLWRKKQRKQEAKYKEQIRTFRSIAEGEEKERSRIAKELHDGLGQLLSTARLNVNALEGSVLAADNHLLNNSLNLIDEAVQEVRNVSHALMPSTLVQLGLLAALRQLVDRLNDTNFIKGNLLCSGLDDRLSNHVEISIYRIVQEILNNAIKYAEADEVHIKLTHLTDGSLTIEISDNGKGVSLNSLEKSTGNGWINIKSRIQMMNGTIHVGSPNNGTGSTFKIQLNTRYGQAI